MILGTLGSEGKTLSRSEVGSPAGALLNNSPGVGDELKLDTVNSIYFPLGLFIPLLLTTGNSLEVIRNSFRNSHDQQA